jgi:hypothetical protein
MECFYTSSKRQQVGGEYPMAHSLTLRACMWTIGKLIDNKFQTLLRTKRMQECSMFFKLRRESEQAPSSQQMRTHGDCEVQPVLFAEQTTTIAFDLDGPREFVRTSCTTSRLSSESKLAETNACGRSANPSFCK